MAKNLTAALALMGATAAAGATPVTVTETISLSQLLSGNSTNIAFNLNAQLAAAGQGLGDILSGDLVVFGYSDAQYNTTQADPYSGYATTGVEGYHSYSVPYTYSYYVSCSYWSWSCNHTAYATGYYQVGVTDYNAAATRTVEHIDSVADTMVVAAGTTSASGSASTHTTRDGGYSGSQYVGTSGDYYNGYTYLYNRDHDVYDAIAGDLSATLHLDVAALSDLNQDGILAPTVSATLGGFHLTSATLTVLSEVVERSEVPEPATLGLFAVAAAGATVARRRRKK
ncbi:PEP-CTERM sorting domain-containing protein [Massilia sp. Root335]|uniref:PEP-CTERM sorting domain-containing protein n=1 Tax=Massilia sp. Root335 TaxID=1736517 RepID=UPI0006F9B61E|nr:PEP-CTERM sorting domain-containing protein [Massilia sp. Root335]KQV33237.1 hypothetical protein ASC93_27125 [Massilia sp. Root335]